MDPVYRQSGIVNAKTDAYAFGVVLFELLTGILSYEKKNFGDDKPMYVIQGVWRYYDVGLEKLIDPALTDRNHKIDRISFNMIKEIAYKCISFNIMDRPWFDVIIKTIDRALDIHNHGAASVNSVSLKIPIEEILQATKSFSSETQIAEVKDGKTYKGQLSERWQNRNAAIKCRAWRREVGTKGFRNEVELISSFHHENIIPFIGYNKGDRLIIVTEYATNGSVEYHLKHRNKRRFLTWSQRLKICLGVATGLNYLHSNLGERGKVIHRATSSRNILLDDNMEAKLCGFQHSVLIPRNQSYVYDYDCYSGTYIIKHYRDPIYEETCFLKTESDVYAFGVVMFELFSGMLANEKVRNKKDDNPQYLMNLVRRYYHDGPDMLLDPLIKDQVDNRSLLKFTDLAYECISFDIRERPSMNRIRKRIQELLGFQNNTITAIQSHQNQNLKDFLIPLEEIKRAIGGDFSSKTQAGDGGFGVVYKGVLSERWEKRIVAIKCLKPSDYDGNEEFLHELKLIFRFQHEHIIPLAIVMKTMK